jgi:hypothetical protein
VQLAALILSGAVVAAIAAVQLTTTDSAQPIQGGATPAAITPAAPVGELSPGLAADAARWAGLAEQYAVVPGDGFTRGLAADAARWAGLAEQYAADPGGAGE